MSKTCPQCLLLNPDSTQRCSCGYRFEPQAQSPREHRSTTKPDSDVEQGRKSLSKPVSAFWFVVLLLVAIGIFWGLDDPPWYVQGIGYLASLVAFGALLEFFKA